MFDWFKKKKNLTPQQKLKAFVDSLDQYPVQLVNRPKSYTYSPTDQSSQPFTTLKGLLEAYVELIQFAIRHEENSGQPISFISFPLREGDLYIWDEVYYDLFEKGAKYYGLKVLKTEKGTWSIRRCLNCNVCSERVDCLTRER